MDKKIVLQNQHTNEPHDFEWNHAVRLLTQQSARGFDCWNLPPDSPYTFQHGNIISRPVKGTARNARERKEDQAGDKTRVADQDAHGAGD